MKKIIFVVLTAILALVSGLMAQAPQTLSYQGILTDAQGDPVATGNVQLSCRLYDAPVSGNLWWSETQQVAVTDGLFDVILGSATPLNLSFNTQYWLALAVDGGAELTPRTELTAAAYSVFAASIADNSVSSDKIQDAAVTGPKIDNGHVVRSINSITDDVALAAGNNIDIVTTGSNLTISATGGGGLTEVASNSTLSGKGTSQSPLRLADAAVSTGKLQNDAVTGSKIDDGHIVRSINSITDDVILEQGNNINIAKSNNKLIISATGSGGLTQVTSNSSLEGKGTQSDPLQLALPFDLAGSSFRVIEGRHSSGFWGALGAPSYGVYAQSPGFSTSGYIGHKDYAVYGRSGNTDGYLAGKTYALYGENASGDWGAAGLSGFGVWGKHKATGNYGYLGNDWAAVRGRNFSGGNSFAGVFTGNVLVNGNLSKSGGSFKIDHPLDPANKYLSHSFVESPDMMNVYNGNAVLDGSGEAVVQLPNYFEALNRDFRYLVTAIGGFAPVYIAEKISNKRFKIAGGEPGMEVSWQITGIRKDRWAEANRIKVEEDKPAEERGFYLNPELFGLSEESSVAWRHEGEMIQKIAETQRMSHEKL